MKHYASIPWSSRRSLRIPCAIPPAAYNRTKHLEERTTTMRAWSDWLWKLAGLG